MSNWSENKLIPRVSGTVSCVSITALQPLELRYPIIVPHAAQAAYAGLGWSIFTRSREDLKLDAWSSEGWPFGRWRDVEFDQAMGPKLKSLCMCL